MNNNNLDFCRTFQNTVTLCFTEEDKTVDQDKEDLKTTWTDKTECIQNMQNKSSKSV